MSTALIGGLILILREAEQRRLVKMTDKVVEKNQAVSPGAVMGFLHLGLSYRHSQSPLGKLAYGALHHTLFDEMDMHVTAARDLNAKLQDIKQALMPIGRLSVCDQDLRDGMPDCLVQVMGNQYSGLARTREPAWMLEPGERAMVNFETVLSDIEFYCAARLIY